MLPERWRRIEHLYHAALERPPAERAALLVETCGDDEALRQEVESLLVEHERTGRILEEPAWKAVAPILAEDSGTTTDSPAAAETPTDPGVGLVGTTVGRFAIRKRLGGPSGMGEVYLADDTKLKRPVALKRVVPRLRTDKQYRRRLLKEAQRASALDHEHIADIYDVLEANDDVFVVMEYVEGETLRERLRGPLSVDESLSVATQCAEALAAAHEKGIIHCDIKPENVMLTPKGRVKILDFGVAKRLPRLDSPATGTTSESQHDGGGGTLPYMAPEVLLFKEPDARADIFSLGVVLYEMLTGQHPFRTPSPRATVDRILHETPPPLGKHVSKVPAGLDRVVTRMLAKQPEDRHANATDLVNELQIIPGTAASQSRPGWTTRRMAIAVAVLGVAALAALYLILRPSPLPTQKRVAVLPFEVVNGNEQLNAFARGLTKTLNDKLTLLTDRHPLQVVPASDVQKSSVRTVQEAHDEFGVNLVITGSIEQSGETLVVKHTLIDSEENWPLGSYAIVASASDPLELTDHIVASVVGSLEIELHPSEQKLVEAHGTSDRLAYGSFILGEGYLSDYTNPENIESAITAFKDALNRDSQYARAYAGLGEAYWLKHSNTKDQRWLEEASKACEQAVRLAPELSDGYTCLGVVHNETGLYELAAKELHQAVELEPTSDDAYRYLASAYERSGKPKQAEETYLRAIELRPQYWAGYSWLGVFYYHQARYQKAAEMFRKITELAPHNIRAYSNLGTVYNDQGLYEQAIQVCERSVAIRPNADAYSNWGTAYFYLRQFDKAGQYYEKAVEMEPQGYLWWGNLGDARSGVPEQRADAKSAYEQAISRAKEDLRINPRDTRALGYLAYYYAMIENKEAALTTIQEALKLAPDNAEIRFNAALIHNQLGQINLALEWLEKALAAGWNPATVRDHPFLDNLRADSRYQELLQRHQT